MITATIIGAAGYTGGELLRLLINHPEVIIANICSTSHADQNIDEVHTDLLGSALNFEAEPKLDVDVIFLCMGHGQSDHFLKQHTLSDKTKVIDLSQDFRWTENSTIGQRQFIYGLPEVYKSEIKTANNIANPGCFATGIQLGLLPLANKQLLESGIVVNATTGTTGAGQAPAATTHFSWRDNNLSTYKVFEHQHLTEIEQTLGSLQSKELIDLSFIPLRGAFSRGIFSTIFLNTTISISALVNQYKEYYDPHPFIHLVENDINLKQVVNTNNAVIQLQKSGSKLLITTAIDNLLKGASGQAVQNMNLMFGFNETSGLKLKGSIF